MKDKIEVVKVLIRNENDRFLVVQKSDKYDWMASKWELPGGKVKEELGEDRLDAAKREVKTETGLRIKSSKDVVRTEVEEFDHSKPIVNCFIMYADEFSGEVNLSSEHQDFKWVAPEEFTDMDWHRDAGYAIPAIEHLKHYVDKET